MSTQHRIDPDTMSAAWGITPAALAWPGRTAGLCAVAFGGRGARRLEVSSAPDAATHILAICLHGHHAALSIDGRVVNDARFETGHAQLVRAGERPVAQFSGDWRVLHLYLPAADLVALAEDLGVPSNAARAMELLVPSYGRDPLFARFGQRLDARLRRGDTPCRLELDEMALDLGGRLIRRHSSVQVPRRVRAAPPHGLSPRERALLMALLADAKDPALADIAALLGRPQSEAERAIDAAFRAAPHHIQQVLRKGKPS